MKRLKNYQHPLDDVTGGKAGATDTCGRQSIMCIPTKRTHSPLAYESLGMLVEKRNTPFQFCGMGSAKGKIRQE